jgi:hypothetical protein
MMKFIKKVSRRSALQTIAAITCFLALLTGCRKDTGPEHMPLEPSAFTIESIRQDFYGAELDKKLAWKVSDSLHITLQPDWEHVRQSTISDTSDYRYIPLNPVTKTAEGIRPVVFANFTSLLIVRNGKEFYEGRYYPDSANKGEADPWRLFYNGRLTMNDLVTGRFYIIDYKDGKPSQNFGKDIAPPKKGQSAQSSQKMSVGTETMGWETRCRTVTTCNWSTVCQNIPQVYSNSPGECTYPTAVTDCDYSAAWERIAPTYSQVCEQVYVPDVPVDPGNPTDPGTTTPNDIITNFTLLAPVTSIDLAKRMACFNNIPTDNTTTYNIQLHVNLPDPANPNVVFNLTDLNPGHVFLTLTKTTGTQMYQLSYGFYPKTDTWITGTKNTVESGIGEESSNEDRQSDIQFSKSVQLSDFNSLMAASIRLAEEKNYNLNSYNCAHYALEIINSTTRNKIEVPVSNVGYITPSGVYNRLNQLIGTRSGGSITKSTINPPLSSPDCN